jgi:BON domain
MSALSINRRERPDMMSSPARKTVVAVGLAVVFGIGVSTIILLPAKQATLVARNAPAAAASSGQADSNSLAPDATATPDPTTPNASAARDAAVAPAAPPAVANPAPLPASAPGNETNDTNAPKARNGNRNGAQARNAQASSIRVASAADVRKSNELPDGGQSSLETSRVDGSMAAAAASTPTADAAPASPDAPLASVAPADGSASGPATDGQITTQVRSAVAGLAPGGNIDVTATSGVVVLTGSVPSQDVVEQARQAAQQVVGVKQVDTSSLLVASR